MEEDQLNDWLLTTLTLLVDRPEELEIERTTDEQGKLYTIKVAEIDKGQVIGRGGSIAEAIRTLLRSAGSKQNIRVSMKLDIPKLKYSTQRREDPNQRPEDRV